MIAAGSLSRCAMPKFNRPVRQSTSWLFLVMIITESLSPQFIIMPMFFRHSQACLLCSHFIPTCNSGAAIASRLSSDWVKAWLMQLLWTFEHLFWQMHTFLSSHVKFEDFLETAVMTHWWFQALFSSWSQTTCPDDPRMGYRCCNTIEHIAS